MPVNFFDAHHTQSNLDKFGLYDDPDPAKNPAYIKENDRETWIGVVNNPAGIMADFYGLDHSPASTIYKNPPLNTERESMCDGVLKHNNSLTFVELKTRKGPGWVAGATDQLINAIKLFAREHNIHEFEDVQGQICNSLRPSFSQNYMGQMERFKDATAAINFKNRDIGLALIVKQDISI